jgi:hypothetical protein
VGKNERTINLVAPAWTSSRVELVWTTLSLVLPCPLAERRREGDRAGGLQGRETCAPTDEQLRGRERTCGITGRVERTDMAAASCEEEERRKRWK